MPSFMPSFMIPINDTNFLQIRSQNITIFCESPTRKMRISKKYFLKMMMELISSNEKPPCYPSLKKYFGKSLFSNGLLIRVYLAPSLTMIMTEEEKEQLMAEIVMIVGATVRLV